MNALLPLWNTLLVHPLMFGLQFVATPLLAFLPAGVAGAVAIIVFTIFLRMLLVPLSLVQIKSQRAQMAIQPEMKAIQRKFKGDREGLARAQMALYKERGINPAAGCLPLLIQMPILFGMYAAMSQLATTGLTLDQVTTSQISSGQVTYAAQRTVEPYPYNQFVLAQLHVVPNGTSPITISLDQNQSSVGWEGNNLPLSAGADLVLTPGSVPPGANANPPNSQAGTASIFFRSGEPDPDGITMDRDVPVPSDQPYVVEIWVNGATTNVDSATAVVTWDPSLMDVTQIVTPPINPADLAFKSPFLWLPSLGQPDVFHLPNVSFAIPGFLLLIMTLSSFLSQRMATMPTEDPQQQAMMRSMAFMPLMYLFFFLNTPSGLVLYWLTSNVFSMFQQYFTVGFGLLGGDLQRLTGRDFQPPWATLRRPPPAPVAALTGEMGNGRVDGYDNDDQPERTPTPGERRAAGATRRPRPGSQGRGRKRGKR
ncbi:MAG: membrane protein insertase YidC [Chloroflexi bacterium]|nr:membrane protein insertase YidC [Chloroflexota bacterium]MBV9596735.1 membrane protein insertase YidC [Chloroflexota bacterium]